MMTAIDINFATNILTSIMNCTFKSITSPFMNPIDPVREKLKGYNIIVKEPVCLTGMMQTMQNDEYQSIQEFVCDFRLMLFNIYRYFGCDSKMGKCAVRLEAMFEQKLLLLPIDIRVKTSMDAILTVDENNDVIELGMSRRKFGDRSHDIRMVTPIKAILDEMENNGTISAFFSDNIEFRNDPMNFLTSRLQKWHKKRRDVQLIRLFDEWYINNTTEYDRHVLDTCSEFVEFVQFVCLGYYAIGLDQLLSETLKIDHITTEDVQYAILFPCSSSILSAIVSLLIMKSKNRLLTMKDPLPNYTQWNKELTERVGFLYKQWVGKHLCDTPDLFLKRFNIDPVFFKVLGQRISPLSNRQFHELSIFQRCHILLAMCYLSLKGNNVAPSAIDKSIEWADHQRIVLSRIGDYEYVRFAGLDDYSSYYIYRMKALQMESDLEAYSVYDDTKFESKRKRKEKPLDKYRMPKWYASVMKKFKSKKPNAKPSKSKRKTSIIVPECPVIISETPEDVSKTCDDNMTEVNEDSNNKCLSDIDTPKMEPSQSGPTSITSNDDDQVMGDNIGPDLLVEYDETDVMEVPEICEPREGEMTLVASDLRGVMSLIEEMTSEMTSASEEEYECYQSLVKNLVDIETFFKDNESQMTKKRNECKECPKLEEEEVDDDGDGDSEKVGEGRVNKRTWSGDGNSGTKRYRTNDGYENGAPDLERAAPLITDTGPGTEAQKVKRKVFQIYNDFFTDELMPVRVKEDGSLEPLAADSVSEERYALARKMIDLYKVKYGLAGPGANGVRKVAMVMDRARD